MLVTMLKRAVRFFIARVGIYLIPSRKCKAISPVEANLTLQMRSPEPNNSPLWDNRVKSTEIDLTMIVPIYNSRKYLEKCMDSILHQHTQYSYEVIAINDGSTDDSGEILERYAADNRIRIIHQNNSGHSGARNRGLREVHGRYVMFVDSDDMLTDNAVEDLLNAAYRYDADIVQGSYYEIDENTDKCIYHKLYADQNSVKPNGVVSGFAWGKVFKADFFEKTCFPEGYWYEDTIVTSILTHLAKKISTISNSVYYYRLNSAGITSTSVGKPKSLDSIYIIACVLKARKKLGLKTDSAFYEHILRLMILCYNRTVKEQELIKRCIFVRMREILTEEKAEKNYTVDRKYKQLEKAILRGDYGRFCILCRVGIS